MIAQTVRMLAEMTVVPFVGAGLVALIFWRRGGWAAGVAISIGFLAALVAIRGWPNVGPRITTDYLFLAALLAAAVGLVESWRRIVLPIAVVIRFAVSVLVAWWFLSRGFKSEQGLLISLLWAAGLGLGIALIWTGADTAAARRGGMGVPLALAALAGLSSLFFMQARSALLMQLSAALGAALLAAALVAWRRFDLRLARGGVGAFVLIHCAMILVAWQYALPAAAPILLGAAPLALWAAQTTPPVRETLGRIAIVLLPAAAALIILLGNAT